MIKGDTNVSDAVSSFLDRLSRVLATLGTVVALCSVGLLVFQYAATASVSGEALRQAADNTRIFGLASQCGALAAVLGFAWMSWGEEILGPIMIIVWSALFFSPSYLPLILGENSQAVGAQALEAISATGLPIGIVGLGVIALDVASRVRTRVREGARSDQLKYGKGLKEEKDIQNVFLGKCWQLPYCRKFVRERCPIYHARRTCWKERVGCMCEESVIRNAMEGRVIPSDIVAAAKYIPYNKKLLPAQMAERCRQCVIYNEHQKHKYRLALPTVILGIVGLYVALRAPLSEMVKGLIGGVDLIVRRATLDTSQASTSTAQTGLGGGGIPFHEIILVALMFLLATYAIRVIEYLIFKIKI